MRGSPNWNRWCGGTDGRSGSLRDCFSLFAVALCVLLPAGLLYWIVRAGTAHNYPLMAAGVAVLGGVFALFVYLIRKNRSES